jgi:hypothetical protein
MFYQLLECIIHMILSYDKRFVVRKGKLLIINEIDKRDSRYALLHKVPEKKFCRYNFYTYVSLEIPYKNKRPETKEYLISYHHETQKREIKKCIHDQFDSVITCSYYLE